MSVSQFFRILKARWLFIAGAVVLALAVATAAAIVLPKRYVATASIVVNGRGDDPLRSQISMSQSGPVVPTQIDIIKGARVASRVVQTLQLGTDAAWREAWRRATGGRGDRDSWIAGELQAALRVTSSADSNVVELRYASRDAEQAARIANAFTDAYLAITLELRTRPAEQYAGFFDDRIREAREGLEAAQGRLSSFEKTNDFVAGVGKADVESARLGELSTQLAQAQAQSADAVARHGGAALDASVSPEVLEYPVVRQLRERIAVQDVKLKELATRFRPTMPDYQAAETELTALRARLDEETRQIAASLATSRQAGNARVFELRHAIDLQRERVLAMQSLRDRDDVLRREMDSAQAAFDLVMQRKSQSALESRTRQADAALLDRAATPFRPASPNIPLLYVLAAAAGFIVGMGAALLREWVQPVLRSLDDLVSHTGLPVLAQVPEAPRRFLTRRLHLGRSSTSPAWLD